MRAGNWYYTVSRHTRSDRTFKEGKIEVTWTGFRLVNKENNKHLDITLTDEEMEETFAVMKLIMKARRKNKW